MVDLIDKSITRGRGPRGPGPPLKLEIYIVNFLEKDRISFFFLLGPPLEKNRSSAPDYTAIKRILFPKTFAIAPQNQPHT